MRRLILVVFLASMLCGCNGTMGRIGEALGSFDAARTHVGLAGLNFSATSGGSEHGGPEIRIGWNPHQTLELLKDLGWDAHLGFLWNTLVEMWGSGEEDIKREVKREVKRVLDKEK